MSELGFRALRTGRIPPPGPGHVVAARVAEDAAAEHDEYLLRGTEVAVPAAVRQEQTAQGLGQFARTIGGYLEFEDRPELRLPGPGISERRTVDLRDGERNAVEEGARSQALAQQRSRVGDSWPSVWRGRAENQLLRPGTVWQPAAGSGRRWPAERREARHV